MKQTQAIKVEALRHPVAPLAVQQKQVPVRPVIEHNRPNVEVVYGGQKPKSVEFSPQAVPLENRSVVKFCGTSMGGNKEKGAENSSTTPTNLSSSIRISGKPLEFSKTIEQKDAGNTIDLSASLNALTNQLDTIIGAGNVINFYGFKDPISVVSNRIRTGLGDDLKEASSETRALVDELTDLRSSISNFTSSNSGANIQNVEEVSDWANHAYTLFNNLIGKISN